LSLFAAAF